MRLSRIGQLAGLFTLVVTASVLVGAAPASADIIVDSAVCLNGASATLVVHPKPFPEAAQLEWTAVLPQPYCGQANGHVFLQQPARNYSVQVSTHGTFTTTAPRFSTTLWNLRVSTSQGSKDLASVWVTLK